MKYSLLAIDDDPDLLAYLKIKLGNEGFEVLTELDGETAIKTVQKKSPDLVLLDVNMPGVSGLDVCQILRSNPETKAIPIIMLTAKGDEVDRVLGLEFGADDYIPKPFSFRELVLRIRNVLKRSYPEKMDLIVTGALSIDLTSHEVKVGKEMVSLTLTEFKLLIHMAQKSRQVITRDSLLENIWEYGDGVYSRTIDTHMQRLRAKLKEAGSYIQTVRGVGYRFQIP